ncbi:intermembrane space import and assembly protein 40 [Ephemerocybe angulata]|uniref:Mitochondrial intermembrane space import and assembly protein 40 n=1 Tax=Ephemerocybe angulata TaxID=980116 RepID=A0A8H6MDQ4_9AGAR|nr:intermembrane space import and assembly protein 40 [Tulosesus angulatus]
MFTRFARQSLRRGLHTASSTAKSAPRFNRTAKVVVGTSAAAAALVSWNLSSEKNRVHLDSVNPSASTSTAPKSTTPTTPDTTPQPSEFVPDAPSDSETGAAAEGTKDEGASEGEAPQPQGAYNPETGEINWDCPCLGGMAHGPCGEQFKEAFSCFVFSEDEPKGINCVDAFKKMQDCFREHPEVYADEIMADDDEEPAAPTTGAAPSDDADPSEKVAEVPSSEPTSETPKVEKSSSSTEGP